VVGIVGFVDVPIVHLSVVWWRSQHQAPALLRVAPRMAPIMGAGLITGLVAFTLLYAYLVTLRLRVGRLEDRAMAEALSPRVGQTPEEIMDDEPEPEPEVAAHG
jgi:heme exporter protein C